MFNLVNKLSLPIGLDISDISVRLVQFSLNSKGGYSVQAYVDKPLSKEVIRDDSVKSVQILVDSIKEALQNPQLGKFLGKQVVASIPETKSFVRVIEMPKMSEQEVKEAIKWEAEQYVPLPLNQVYLDWIIIGDLEQEHSGKMKVLLTASPKDYIDDLTSYLKQAGLRPVALEVESQATARSLVSDDANDTALILDINAVRSSFIIFDHGTLQFTSSMPIAGNSFSEAITKVMNITFDEAEKIKRKVGLEKEAESGQVRKALLPVLSNLVSEIKNTIKFYEEHTGSNVKISRLILTGGSSKLKDLPPYLVDRLKNSKDSTEHKLRSIPGMRVELGNPWAKIFDKGQVLPISRLDSLSFSTAIGLALREAE